MIKKHSLFKRKPLGQTQAWLLYVLGRLVVYKNHVGEESCFFHAFMHFRPFHCYTELNPSGEGQCLSAEHNVDGDKGQKLACKGRCDAPGIWASA